jgi:ABC-2 type transport system permease protein
MTAATLPRPNPSGSREGSTALAGVGTLVRHMLRRDRVKLPAWAGGMGLFVLYVTTAIPAAYSLEDLQTMGSMFGDPIGRMFIGPGFGLDDITYERIVANGYGLYLMLLAALMSILLVTRHTRVEEQSGRAELVRANVVGPRAPLVAALLVALITNVAAGLAALVVLVGVGGYSWTGSVVLAASIVAVGLTFGGITAVTAQVTEYSRAAAGLAGAILGAAFFLRAGGDMIRQGGSGLSWFSPLAWGQQTAPFVLDRWWPLLLNLAVVALTVPLAVVLSAHRDLGGSFLRVRPGPPRAHPSLGTPVGLAFRLQRASIIGWGASLVVGGMFYGAFADALRGAIEDMPDVFVELFGADNLLAGYLAYMAMFMALFVAAYVIMALHGMRSEEIEGRGEPLLATPLSRTAWLGSNLVVIAGGAAVILAVTGLATGAGAAIVTGEGRHVADLTLAHLNHLPAVYVVLGVVTLLFGMWPSSIGLAWALPVYGMLAGTFGQLLDLPSLAYDLSPFEHPSDMPLEPFAIVPALVLLAVAAGLATAGVLAFGRREIDTT